MSGLLDSDDHERARLIRSCALVLVDATLRLLQDDPHSWSTRPCDTCRAITSMIGRRFGCYLYAEQEQARRARAAEETKK